TALAYLLATSLVSFTAPPEIAAPSLHDALPISLGVRRGPASPNICTFMSYLAGPGTRTSSPLSARHECCRKIWRPLARNLRSTRSEEHTSELQSLTNLVCRLLLAKKKAPRAHVT